jgi:periplasmic protein TonB
MKAVRRLVLFVSTIAFHALAAQEPNVPPPPLPPPMLELGPSDTTEVHDIAALQEQPKFPGGDEGMRRYLAENIHYPDTAIAQGQQGRVYIEFEIDTAGHVGRARVRRGVSGAPALEAEALRVVKAMPPWSPGRMNDKPVRCRFVLPISFTLGTDQKK